MDKVLHLIDSSGMYGAEKVVLTLLSEIKHSNYPGILGCIRESKDVVPKIAECAINHGIEVVFFTMKRGFNIVGIYNLHKYLVKNKIALVHSHGYKPNIFLALLPQGKFKKITTVHGWANQTAGIKTNIYECLDRLSLKKMNAVIAVSNALVNDLLGRNINKNKLYLIHNGINITLYKKKYNKQQLRTKYDLAHDDFVIGTIGRLTKIKGQAYLIESLPSILKTIKNCKVIIAGEGPLREQLTKLISKYNLKQNIRLIGYVDDIHEVLGIIDLFILPSLSEGLPIALLEAMSSGVPSIASAVGGINEIINNNIGGIIITPRDTVAITNAVIKLYKNKEFYNKLKTDGMKIVEDNYSTKKMVEEYINIYSNLLNEK